MRLCVLISSSSFGCLSGCRMLPVGGCEGATIIEAEIAGVVLFFGKGDALPRLELV